MIRLGTRRSPLAQAQTRQVLAKLPLGAAAPVVVENAGDLDRVSPLHKMERPGAFTHALTDAILDGRLDAAVHSLKDLPLDAPADAPIVAILPRGDPSDSLVAREDALDAAGPLGLAAGSRVGTSAPRRQSQLHDADPSLVPVDVRGNVGTRLRLVEQGLLEALLVASCALDRLGVPLPAGLHRIPLDARRFPPCPGQGAIAVQAAAGSDAASILAGLDDAGARTATALERDLLRALGGGCGLPLGAHAQKRDAWELHATLAAGGRLARAAVRGPDPSTLAQEALAALRRAPEPAKAPMPSPGRTLAITFEADRLPDYEAALAGLGWRVVAWPLTRQEPTGAPLPRRWEKAAWVAASSPRAAAYVPQALQARPVRVAAVGPATAAALRREGLAVHLVSRHGTGESLAAGLASFPAARGPVLVPQAEEPAGDLEAGLHRRGIPVLAWPVYRTLPLEPIPPFPAGAEAVAFTSPSAVHALLGSGQPVPRARLLAFGPTTARAMADAGLHPDAVCPHPSPAGLCQVLP